VVVILILNYGIDSTVPIYGGLAVSITIFVLGSALASGPPRTSGRRAALS
jgi:hypothetical protein